MWITTLPPAYSGNLRRVAQAPGFGGARLNTGAKTPYDPATAIKITMEAMGNRHLFIDLKGRQLRITQWAVPTYGDVILNHELEVDLPADIIFRGSDISKIVRIAGNKIYVDPPPAEAVGDGQAINVHGTNLKIKGYLTDDDRAFISAAKDLGVHRYMLSFVEEESDIADVLRIDPEAKIWAKIESPKGLDFVREKYPAISSSVRLVAACDDMFINIGSDKTEMFDALDLIIEADPNAVAASRIFTSLEKQETIALADLTHLRFLESIGYESFMLSDGLCVRPNIFERVLPAVQQYRAKFDAKKPSRIKLFEEEKRERGLLERFGIRR